MKKDEGYVYVTRRMTFSSAHRLHHPEQDNEVFYGPCANLHGHNYIVEVTICGLVDPQTGFLMNLKDLKSIMKKRIKEPLDHKNLDCGDISFFINHVQSAENITIFIWDQLSHRLPKNVFLYRVRLHETENNTVEYFG